MQPANLFELHNASLKVTFSSSSFDGKPQLSYQKGSAAAQNFRGSQLHQTKTDIGTLITVTLQAVPDLKTITFSLLLPQVNVPDGQSQAKVAVKAIETTTKSSIAGPKLVSGQLQTYKVYSLNGTAKSVSF